MHQITPDYPVRSARMAQQSAHRAALHAPDATLHGVRSQTTRILHLLLLLAVVHQLASSQWMERPLPGDPPGALYALHEYVGLASFAVVTAFWAWTLVRRGETRLGRLLPWLSASRRRDLVADVAAQLRRVAGGRWPDDTDGAFASAVHGLGLLAVSAMAATGTVVYVAQGAPIAHVMLNLHKLIANLTWAYLFAHAGLAALHHLLGSDIFSRMFWVGGRRGSR